MIGGLDITVSNETIGKGFDGINAFAIIEAHQQFAGWSINSSPLFHMISQIYSKAAMESLNGKMVSCPICFEDKTG